MNDEINQTRVLGRVNNLKIKNGRALSVDSKGWGKRRAYTIDLIALSEKPKRVYRLAWRWLIAMAVFLLLSYSSSYALPMIDEAMASFSPLVNAAGTALVFLSFVMFWLRSSRQLVFYSRHASMPLVEVWSGKPSSKACKEFIRYTESQIALLHEQYNLTEDQQLSGEMKMLRRLSEEGVLETTSYEKAKKKIMKRF